MATASMRLSCIVRTSNLKMCDYSLHAVASRPARIGDQLITTKFPNTVTRGFCALEEPHVAVCLLPGTEIAFEKEVEFDIPLRSFCPASVLANWAPAWLVSDKSTPMNLIPITIRLNLLMAGWC